MSTSLLYHGWGLRGYHHRRTEYREGAVHFVVEHIEAPLRCSHCGSEDVMPPRTHLRQATVQATPVAAPFVASAATADHRVMIAQAHDVELHHCIDQGLALVPDQRFCGDVVELEDVGVFDQIRPLLDAGFRVRQIVDDVHGTH